jgi:hypothetical protein
MKAMASIILFSDAVLQFLSRLVSRSGLAAPFWPMLLGTRKESFRIDRG